MTEYETISIEKRGQVDWLTLNRPEALNAISTPMVTELRDYFGGLAEDRDTRVVVMRGAGDVVTHTGSAAMTRGVGRSAASAAASARATCTRSARARTERTRDAFMNKKLAVRNGRLREGG